MQILVARYRRGASLLHAGLLICLRSVCASSASITWERIASRPETGLLIPSVYNSFSGGIAEEGFSIPPVPMIRQRCRRSGNSGFDRRSFTPSVPIGWRSRGPGTWIATKPAVQINSDNHRLSKLRSELLAIDLWDSDYFLVKRPCRSDEAAYQSRQLRRKELLLEVQQSADSRTLRSNFSNGPLGGFQ